MAGGLLWLPLIVFVLATQSFPVFDPVVERFYLVRRRTSPELSSTRPTYVRRQSTPIVQAFAPNAASACLVVRLVYRSKVRW